MLLSTTSSTYCYYCYWECIQSANQDPVPAVRKLTLPRTVVSRHKPFSLYQLFPRYGVIARVLLNIFSLRSMAVLVGRANRPSDTESVPDKTDMLRRLKYIRKV